MSERASISKPVRVRRGGRPSTNRLAAYLRKRDFSRTTEPRAQSRGRKSGSRFLFVVQEHHARRLHFDLRLEARGVLKSWAVTREPSAGLGVRRLAIETEDHPLPYAKFAGRIPKGEYGAGVVRIWDRGSYESAEPVEDAMANGHINVVLRGKKLRGRFVLIRISGEGPRARWLFFKMKPRPAALRIPRLRAQGRSGGLKP